MHPAHRVYSCTTQSLWFDYIHINVTNPKLNIGNFPNYSTHVLPTPIQIINYKLNYSIKETFNDSFVNVFYNILQFVVEIDVFDELFYTAA